jgi:UDP-glucose 4-epimerase
MKVLVTGASGFIGRHLVRELLQAGHTVSTLHRGPALPEVREHTQADILSAAAPLAVRGVDGIIHLAGRGNVDESFREPELYHRVNAVGTLALLGAAREYGAALVLASTQRVYQPRPQPLDESAPTIPTTPYGYSKLVAETWVRAYARLHAVRGVSVRIFSVYGPGQAIQGSGGVVTIFLRRALAGEPITVTGRQRQDFSHVADIARGLRLALERGTAGEVYNLATGVGTSILDLAEAARAALDARSAIHEQSRPAHDGDLVADVRKAERELGFRAQIPLADGLRQYAAWLRTHG